MKRPTALIGVDTGGTFTDLVALVDGQVCTVKVLSTPSNPALAVLRGLQELIADRPPDSVTYASTVATNALLQRKGARVVLVTTAGFEDVIEIGRQNRPVLYDLEPRRPEPLIPRQRRVGVRERVSYDGRVVEPLTSSALRAVVRAVRRARPCHTARCLPDLVTPVGGRVPRVRACRNGSDQRIRRTADESTPANAGDRFARCPPASHAIQWRGHIGTRRG